MHAVADLDAAAAFYAGCGFQVGACNRHPWGTHNRLVQFPEFFIEILTLGEPEKLGDDGLSQHFGRFNQRAIARRDGLSMLIVASDDAEADAAEFARAGIGTSGPLPFSREAILADGGTATVGFTLAFARDPNGPHTGFAACAHRNPNAFWNAKFQQHRNSAIAMSGVVLAAERPWDHQGFFQALTACDVSEQGDGIVVRTPSGDIEMMTQHAFAQRTGVALAPIEGAELQALRFAVPSLSTVEDILRFAPIASKRIGSVLVVPPQAAFGATLIFEEGHAR